MPVQRLHDEHRDIKEMLAQLEATVTSGEVTDQEATLNLVRQLVAGLEDHFQFEEQGGLFSELASQNASFDRRVRELLGQHTALRTDFRAVLGLFEAGKPTDEIAKPLADAASALRLHEQKETDFLQDALSRDIGVGD